MYGQNILGPAFLVIFTQNILLISSGNQGCRQTKVDQKHSSFLKLNFPAQFA